MAPTDAPSPTPSTTAGPKRARATGGTKRKKPEGSAAPDAPDAKVARFGVGMVKGREEEWVEPGDVRTKINFLDLPIESLYKYLEANDLVPNWDPIPWSESPCEPPNDLFLNPPQPSGVNTTGGSPKDVPAYEPAPAERPQDRMDEDKKEEPKEGKDGEEGEQGEDEEDGDGIGARTTRSKTAPQRRKSPEIAPRKHGVFTLSDVHACRAILAEKANQHWMKGLGGGQNREGETIVNFLYKNKVGHGRLLRVYNPTPAPFS